jgi:hypothetical protein
MGNGAAKEVGFDIISEGSLLDGYQLKLEICKLDNSNMTSSFTQTIDLTNFEKETNKFIPLNVTFDDSLPGKLNVSLLDSDKTVVEGDYVFLNSLNQLQGLQVNLDGLTKKVSVSTLNDRLGMALLSAPQS